MAALTYLKAAVELLGMPDGPSRASARTVIKLARLAADQVEASLEAYPEIDLGELVDVTLAVIERSKASWRAARPR